MAEIAPRNPALLVAAGTRARLELTRGVAADVVRGATPGPTVWLWATRGSEDPSLQQALAELRDELDPAQTRGAVGMLVDGPAPPLARETYAHAPLVRSMMFEATGAVLLCGAPVGETVAAHAACDPDDARDRRLARSIGIGLVAPAVQLPPVNRGLLAAPATWLVAGEAGRFDRATCDRVRVGLLALLHAVGVAPAYSPRPRAAVVRGLVTLPLPTPGLVEPLVACGQWVRRNMPVASVGPLGHAGRQLVRAPHAGIVLRQRSGQLIAGNVATLAPLPAALPEAPRDHELGWCELVDLPDLGVSGLPAKIDTGARTSALHVSSRRPIGRSGSGRPLYEIEVPAGGADGTVRARVEVVEQATIRDSGGHDEKRLVIETALRLGDHLRTVRLSLTDRGDMKFPMLVGRTALDGRTRIDPTREFLTRPKRI